MCNIFTMNKFLYDFGKCDKLRKIPVIGGGVSQNFFCRHAFTYSEGCKKVYRGGGSVKYPPIVRAY